MSFRLRGMLAADLSAVLDLEGELFPEDAWTRAMFAAEVSGRLAARYYLVAEEDGQIVGYAGLLAPGGGPAGPGGQADVMTMAVAPSRWGQGIGSALLEALLAEAAARGCTEVFLEVRVDNPRAQRLYRRHGFAEAGLRRGYYQPSGTDALVMRRPLDPAEYSAPRGQAPAAGPYGVPPAAAPRSAAPRSPASRSAAPPSSAPERRS